MKQQLMFLKAALCLMLLLFVAVASQAQAHAESIAPPPSPSRGALDIGYVGHTGAFIENGDTDRIWGSGSDIWGSMISSTMSGTTYQPMDRW